MSKSQMIQAVHELIEKAQGYTKHTGSGSEAEAVSHSIPTTEPKGDEKDKEENEANSGTHPESGGKAGKDSRAEGGADFVDGGPEEDTIETPKGSGNTAPVARPDTIKHEGGSGVGPDHPGTATQKQSQQKSEDEDDLDLKKSEDKDDDKDDDSDNDDAEKSEDSGDIYLDIDQFTQEIVAKAVEVLDEKYAEFTAQAIKKSEESEYIEAGLAKSIASALDRLEELEKSREETDNAVVNIAKALNIRKSLLTSADNIKGIDNPSLSRTELSKSEISSRLLDMQMAGNQGVDTSMVLRFDAVGDPSILPENIRQKLGI